MHLPHKTNFRPASFGLTGLIAALAIHGRCIAAFSFYSFLRRAKDRTFAGLILMGCVICALIGCAFRSAPAAGNASATSYSLNMSRPGLVWMGMDRLPGYTSHMTPKPLLVSDDGATIYGEYGSSSGPGDAPVHFFRWKRNGGIVEVPATDLPKGLVPSHPGSHHLATERYLAMTASYENVKALQKQYGLGGLRGVSLDGKTILGDFGSAEGVQYPYLWRAATGVIRLKEYAAGTLGIQEKLTGYAYAASADGKTVAGIPDTPDGTLTDLWVLYDPQGFAPATRITGIVTALTKEGLTLSAQSVTFPNGKTIALQPTRVKRILLSSGTVRPATLKPGSRVIAAGSDGGVGKPLIATRLTLSP